MCSFDLSLPLFNCQGKIIANCTLTTKEDATGSLRISVALNVNGNLYRAPVTAVCGDRAQDKAGLFHRFAMGRESIDEGQVKHTGPRPD